MLERLASTRGFLNGKEDIPSHWADVGELKIPRFKFDFGFEASEALKGLGLEVPSTIIHKSCIEVDEVGSKAAAAAVIFVGCCGPAEKRKYTLLQGKQVKDTSTIANTVLPNIYQKAKTVKRT
ncbi:putative Serpin superfamily protein [Arabidopsis thaliana]|uniref:Serpin n=1 Tax=Arabidopsis thaliana TaxID=3702 RepID=A0A1P8AYE6_ARATH|nr:serpin [Arabidopsis thaliana]ANM61694.1 serpin [Arabidopsis thaliana]|eukprot:NP_001323897.1 serpin [Arabidopsis thaliana]